MPYSFSPPSFSSRSNSATSWPSIARRCAQDSPAGPPPTTATRCPLASRPREQLHLVIEHRVGRVALQQADLHRFVLVRVADAGLLAEHLGRADARAHTAHDVLGQDRVRRAAQVIAADLLDEQRYVDAGRAGGGARRIETEIAAVRLDQRFRTGQWRVEFAEVPRDLVAAQAVGANIGHRRLSA